MAATIKIKRSAVAGKAPSTSDINGGELALNTKDGRLYSSDGTNKIIEIGANNHSLFVGTGGVSFANGAYTFPTADGNGSQVIQTNGSGTLSFAGPFETTLDASGKLANTNTFIATKLDTSTFNAALANTNTYIATKLNTSTFNAALANTNAYIASKQAEVLNAKGDLVVTTGPYGSGTARLPVGSDGQVLLANSGATYGVSWQAAPSGGATLAADNISAGDAAVNITTSTGNITIDAAANDSDIIFKGTDATADITMLTLDGSAAGKAIFNAGAQFSGDIDIGDTHKIIFGAGDDLEIYHAGGGGGGDHDNIIDNKNRELFVQSSDKIIFTNTGGKTEFLARFIQGGAVELYHNTTKRIETTATGITVSGNTVIPDNGTIGTTTTPALMTLMDNNVRLTTTSTTDTDAVLQLYSADTGSGSSPDMFFWRNSSSPAASDFLGKIIFYGENDASEAIPYASLSAQITDPVDGSENGRFIFTSKAAGSDGSFTMGGDTTGHVFTIPDGSHIGSTSDRDAISIGSDGDVTLTQDLELQHDGASISFGTNDEIKLTHVHDTGLALTDSGGTPTLQLHDSNEAVSSDGTNLILTSGGTAFKLPTADGSADHVLKTDGGGNLSFVAQSGGASEVFKTVAIATSGSTQGTASVVADSATDTLTLIQGAGIQLTTNATSDSIKIDSVQDVQDQLFANGTHFTAGTNTTIQLSRSYDSEASLWISFDGVLQFPDQYSISGNLVTFTSAIPTGTQQVYVKGGKVLPATGDVTGSSTTTFTNKNIDADNNTISNLEVDNFKATAIVLEGEGIGSNDNDTTLPTSAAVKDYVDNNAGGVVTALNNATANELVTVGSTTTELDAEANLTFDGSTLAVTGDITATGTVLVTGDTSSGDDAAIGYTAAEGLILTGQGSTSDVTIKNDADQEVLKVPTGTVNIETAGTIKTVGDIIADGDGSSGGITLSDGSVSIRTGTGSVAAIDLYCESGNAHKVTIQSPAHADYSGDVTLTLPTTSGTLTSTGKQSIYIPAAAMYPTTTSGCADLAQVEGTAGRPELKCLDFDPSSNENAQFSVAFPKAWNAGTITFQAFFTVSGTNTGAVVWKLSAVAIGDNDPIDATFGTAIAPTAKAHSGVSGDMDVTAESSAMTVAGSPGADEMVFFNVLRDTGYGNGDTQTGDARLLGIKLFFTTDKANDE